MNLMGVVTLIGGLALFLYGMDVMGKGLTNLSGGQMESLLSKLTSNRLFAVLLGLGVTAVIQSSSATTVMVVGFVNSGIMKLAQAAGVIMGANIGTTVTSWLMSLTGIQSDQIILQIMKPTFFSPILAAIGVIFILFCKEKRKKDIGSILVGFAILMFGMETMSGAVKPLANDPNFTKLMTAFTNPILGVIAGAVLTAIIQSSSASVGILQALCMTGSVPFAVALPVIMGQNIGTCVTALISSIGASKNAKRAAMIHLYFNLIGVAIFMAVFYILNAIFKFSFLSEMATPAGIAIIHSIFNISVTIVLFPFLDKLVKLACFTIRDKEDDAEQERANDLARLDERFLTQPAVAVDQGQAVLLSMAAKSMSAFRIAVGLLDGFSEEKAEQVDTLENEVDHYQDALGAYLVKASERELLEHDSERVSVYLQNIGDLERISDRASNIVHSFREMNRKKIAFSDDGVQDLKVLTSAVTEVSDLTLQALQKEDPAIAENVEPLEEVVDRLTHQVRKRHIARLRDGSCTVELGNILADLSTNMERVSDHCSNLASSLLLVDKGGYDTHEYLTEYRRKDNEHFRVKYEQMADKYQLP
ncbi:MAG: Na/Pi cotransporter family protein [Eubacterium sp.]|nr:Na/Pi cotransporter family protein [Eubacterium sp.]